MNNFFQATDLIHSYSRAQAIADGELIDVTDTAREAGFTVFRVKAGVTAHVALH